MEIELSVKISEEDYVKINKEIYKKSKKTIVQWFTLIIAWFFTSCLLILGIIDLLDGKFLENLFLNLYIIVLLLCLIFGIPQLRIYNYKKFYRKNKILLEILHYNIDDEFINVRTRLSESKSSWEVIMQVQEITAWFLLRPNTVSFHALPKDQLNRSQQVWLKEKVKKTNKIS
jgi:hypothetical protein